MTFFEHYNQYRTAVEEALQTIAVKQEPQSLYEPIRYILSNGGKRVRPVLSMMACAAVGGNPFDALYVGIAVEILHNFTLVHDDIMDAAAMRRNRPTVHVRWNENAAILSGDSMMAIAYQVMMQSKNLRRLPELVSAMTTGIVEVCEGQAFDLEFQERDNITLTEYFVMIEKKTAKMLELAVQMGGVMGNASEEQLAALAEYALAVGKAFQVLDDLLDITAETPEFGKTIGGDVLEGKKTYLVLRAVERLQHPRSDAEHHYQALLQEFLQQRGFPPERVPEIKQLFEDCGIFNDARREVEHATQIAHKALERLPDAEGRMMLKEFAMMLLDRSF